MTFGGEYRRSFIGTNRKSIATRYGFLDVDLDNKEYLDIVPNYFVGHVAKLAYENNFIFEIVRAVRYANNCRYWMNVFKENSSTSKKWFLSNAESKNGGTFYKNLVMPRFREVRSEIDQARLL